MDEIERRLRRDAQSIEAEVPPELTARIRAAVRSGAEAMSGSPSDARSDDDVRVARMAGSYGSGRRRVHERAVGPRAPERAAPPLRLWAAASLSGIAAALVVVLLLPRLGPDEPARAPQPAAVATQPAAVATLPPEIAREFPLVVKTADLTAPLEQELDALESDLDKARERVKRDLDF